MSIGRFYISKDGREIASFVFEGCGSYVPGTTDRREIYVFEGRRIRTITVADFGGETVQVKLWFPDVRMREHFRLVP